MCSMYTYLFLPLIVLPSGSILFQLSPILKRSSPAIILFVGLQYPNLFLKVLYPRKDTCKRCILLSCF